MYGQNKMVGLIFLNIDVVKLSPYGLLFIKIGYLRIEVS